jgi:hypothetical protein
MELGLEEVFSVRTAPFECRPKTPERSDEVRFFECVQFPENATCDK